MSDLVQGASISSPIGGLRPHDSAVAALVDLSSATIQWRAWLGKVAKRPAVAALVAFFLLQTKAGYLMFRYSGKNIVPL